MVDWYILPRSRICTIRTTHYAVPTDDVDIAPSIRRVSNVLRDGEGTGDGREGRRSDVNGNIDSRYRRRRPDISLLSTLSLYLFHSLLFYRLGR